MHKVAAFLAPRLEGAVVTRSALRGVPGDPLAGRRIAAVRARGKHLLVEVDGGATVSSHLGMHGAWHWYAPGERWRRPERQASIVLHAGGRVYVCFNAARVEVLATGGIRASNFHARLGPDLLADELDVARIAARAREFAAPDSPLCDVLLDQRIASGIGNVYKCEVLFIERAAPAAALGAADDALLARLYARAAGLLRRNVRGTRRVTRFVNDGRGRLWVYGRAGAPCLRCDAAILRAPLGKGLRGTWWCPDCQSG